MWLCVRETSNVKKRESVYLLSSFVFTSKRFLIICRLRLFLASAVAVSRSGAAMCITDISLPVSLISTQSNWSGCEPSVKSPYDSSLTSRSYPCKASSTAPCISSETFSNVFAQSIESSLSSRTRVLDNARKCAPTAYRVLAKVFARNPP